MTTDNSQTVTLASIAGEAYDAFTTITRGEDTIVTLKDDAPEWVREMVQAAHGDFLPDDWRYEAIRSAVAAIHHDDGYDLDDMGAEWADGHVDVYTHARLQWLASNLNRPAYCDEAVDEGLCDPSADLVQRIGMGQYMESREVFDAVRSALEDELSTREED